MITFDSLREALRQPKPWGALDDLVRAEQAAGRKVAEIAGDFDRHSRDVWEASDLSEDSQDAFGDTRDALTGNCHPDSCYRDPPNDTLPTVEEIAKLPRWARVAFAARCARRVLPLYLWRWADAPMRHTRAVVDAIVVAEQSAEAAFGSELASSIAQVAELAATEASHMVSTTNGNAAVAASNAASAAIGNENSAAYVVSSFRAATTAVTFIARHTSSPARLPDFRRDFETLRESSESFAWTDHSPVAPNVFGPMWVNGPPSSWPAVEDIAISVRTHTNAQVHSA